MDQPRQIEAALRGQGEPNDGGQGIEVEEKQEGKGQEHKEQEDRRSPRASCSLSLAPFPHRSTTSVHCSIQVSRFAWMSAGATKAGFSGITAKRAKTSGRAALSFAGNMNM